MLRLPLLTLTALLLLSCGTVTIKESTFYTDVSPNGAIVTHFYDPSIERMGQAAWDRVRGGMTCMPAQTFGDLKIELEQLCSKTKCDKEAAQATSAFLDRQIRVSSSLLLVFESN